MNQFSHQFNYWKTMKVKTKYKITNTMLASISVMIDRSDEKDSQWWKSSEKFVKDIQDMDASQLSVGQKNWLVSIIQKLRAEGM